MIALVTSFCDFKTMSEFIVGVVRGAHPQSYHAFIEVLCNYIVERHKSSQGEDLPYANIYVRLLKAVCIFHI